MIALNRYRLRYLVKEGKRSAIISEKLLKLDLDMYAFE